MDQPSHTSFARLSKHCPQPGHWNVPWAFMGTFNEVGTLHPPVRSPIVNICFFPRVMCRVDAARIRGFIWINGAQSIVFYQCIHKPMYLVLT
jgi:hypothetical protein